ncbi:SDR family oxidoreductase [Streptomyces hebeiensis]|uniref:SDR family oxidoreductase n=1 Tax=Streptomyces hebeiensis TaxID=229486 RepID=UPI0031D5623A
MAPSRAIRRQCVPRRVRPEDVAAVVTFLVGPSASFITGQAVHVDPRAVECCRSHGGTACRRCAGAPHVVPRRTHGSNRTRAHRS